MLGGESYWVFWPEYFGTEQIGPSSLFFFVARLFCKCPQCGGRAHRSDGRRQHAGLDFFPGLHPGRESGRFFLRRPADLRNRLKSISKTAAITDYSVTESDDGGDSNAVTFSIVCATPQDLTFTAANLNNGTMIFNYSFKSSTGDPKDLAACKAGESVFYPGSNAAFIWPPPMVDATPNPSVIMGIASNSVIVDHNFPPANFQTPYFNASFTATQRLRYSCGCKNNGNLTNFIPDFPIVRRVFQDVDGLFKQT